MANEPGLLALLRTTKVPSSFPTKAFIASFFDHEGFNHKGSAFATAFFLPNPIRLLKGDENGELELEAELAVVVAPVVDRRVGLSPASTNACCCADDGEEDEKSVLLKARGLSELDFEARGEVAGSPSLAPAPPPPSAAVVALRTRNPVVADASAPTPTLFRGDINDVVGLELSPLRGDEGEFGNDRAAIQQRLR